MKHCAKLQCDNIPIEKIIWKEDNGFGNLVTCFVHVCVEHVKEFEKKIKTTSVSFRDLL